jgi:arylsulfatase A-like enzyme
MTRVVSTLLILLIAMCFSTSPVMASESVGQPNIIFILSDDQGYGDVGVYGGDDINTPNLDRLAESGVRFTQFYANASVCSPSRAAVLTGQVPQHAGVPGNVPPPPWGQKGLPTEKVTMAELLKEQGYRTAQIGKWHLGSAEGLTPMDQGFDYSFGFRGGVVDNYSHFFYWNGPNRHDLQRNNREIHREGEYLPDMMHEEIVNFIDDTGDEPFFVYYAYGTPHYPYQGDAKWLEYYRKEGTEYPRDLYSAFVSTMDERIGQLLDALEARGLAENTLIIFQTDHGHSTEERAHFGGGSAGPYRGGKFSLFEGGIRVPAFISWPKNFPAGEVRDQFVTGVDWMATIADISDTDVSELSLDGHSLLPIIGDENAESAYRDYLWELDGRWAVREGPWKLLIRPRDTTERHDPDELAEKDQQFLVNLNDDPGEQNNVATDHPEIVEHLLQIREKHRKTY